MSLRGVLIDFGYTIAYIDKADVEEYDESLFRTLRRYGYHGTLKDFNNILDRTYRNNMKGEAKNVHELWKSLLENTNLALEPSLIQELTVLRERHLPTRLKLYNNVRAILSILKKRYRLCLVSNCFVGLSDYIKLLGLTEMFHCIVLSYEVGLMKPDKRIYLEALKRLRLKPEECIFVSDEISDLEEARQIGLRTLLVRQGEYTMHNAKDPNFKPDYECDDIREILDFL